MSSTTDRQILVHVNANLTDEEAEALDLVPDDEADVLLDKIAEDVILEGRGTIVLAEEV